MKITFLPTVASVNLKDEENILVFTPPPLPKIPEATEWGAGGVLCKISSHH
jgi:hypothetical protein